MKQVEGKVAFITGGASGIGFGMAQAFLRSGMKVMIADVLQERLDEAARILAQGTNRDFRTINPHHQGRRDRSLNDGRSGGGDRASLRQGACAVQQCRSLRKSADRKRKLRGLGLGAWRKSRRRHQRRRQFPSQDDCSWRGRPHRQHLVDGWHHSIAVRWWALLDLEIRGSRFAV
jgi:hypothetical protein